MVLKVISTHLYEKENGIEHHTDRFKLLHHGSTAIFRRGQPFYMGVELNRPLDLAKDIVKIVFVTGHIPKPSKGTSAVLIVKEKADLDDKKWDARFENFNGSTIILQVQIPPYAPVSVWKITIQTSTKNMSGIKKHKIDMDVYILFNPWCPNDDVYMDDEEQLEEYVLNENGKVFQGTFNNPIGHQWFFGQFEVVILPCIMMLIDRGSMEQQYRSDPVKMARCLSAIMNNVDDNGLIVGKWGGDFSDGTTPFAWISSMPIFNEFYHTKSPVKYGQCWVFSAVLVTICRALGIPCRSVTNFTSAHDTNSSLTVDTYVDVNGETINHHPESQNKDSFWNFHVWNDVWMERRDLPKGYGGWQSIDGTPQETSDSIYRCGPAPLEAIRRGEVNLGFDTAFVYTEVRADMLVFKQSEEGYWWKIKTYPNHAGKLIVTKKIGQDIFPNIEDMENITKVYKNVYNSPEDKIAMIKAIKVVPVAQQLYDIEEKQIEDVEFELIYIDQINLGESFQIAINIHNTSSETRIVSIVLSASSILYTGSTIDKIKKSQSNIVLKPNQRENIHTYVKPSEYMEKLSAHSLIRITGMASVQETEQLWNGDDDIIVKKPPLDVNVRSETVEFLVGSSLQLDVPCEAMFSFTNPLSITLTECTFSIEGPGIHKIVKFRDVLPNETNVTHREMFMPEKDGRRSITASFNSKQINDIKNTITASCTL